MNLNFPSRFLKKLNIYQQIRDEQGISKYKHLWKYEAAFLQTAYGKGHQHLSNFVSRKNFKKWIEETTQFKSKKDENELNHIISNLFWRGYIEVVERVDEKKGEEAKEKVIKGLELLDRETHAFKSSAFGDNKKWDYRPTEEGLLIGEVLHEIHNKKPVLAFWNSYRYSWPIDTLWLLAFLGIMQLGQVSILHKPIVLVDISSYVEVLKIPWLIVWFLIVFVFWPLLMSLYRWIYGKVDK